MSPNDGPRDRYVAVIGPRTADEHLYRLAYQVGAELAARGAVLLCGGLTGVMEAAARGAREANPPGRSIGLLPGTERADGNPYLDYALPTGLGEARDGALVSSADAVIAVGCNPGTLIEIGYALKRQRPLAVLAGWSVLDTSGEPVAGFRTARTAAEAVTLVLGPASCEAGQSPTDEADAPTSLASPPDHNIALGTVVEGLEAGRAER